jgi:predicted ABC-type transport system involved in lysophospholipase L1 biosynthesis ATPase subunit
MSASQLRRLTTAARMLGVDVAPDAVTGRGALHVPDLRVTSGTLVVALGDPPGQARTLLLALAGRVPIVRGRVEVAGHPLSGRGTDPLHAPQLWRRRVGGVAARPTLFAHLNVTHNVALTVRWSGNRQPREQVRNLCRSVGLDPVKDRFPAELSRPDRQRVALAMALSFDPDLLVVDAEPDGDAPEGHHGSPGAATAGLAGLSRTLVDLVRIEGRTIVTTLATPTVRDAADQILTLVGGSRLERAET